MADREVIAHRRQMLAALRLPLHLLREHPGVVLRFAFASLGRAALTAATILLIREFLAGARAGAGGPATRVAQAFGTNAALWITAALLLLAHLGAAALAYDSQVTQQRIVKVIELGTMQRLIAQLLRLSAGYFDRRTQGDIIQGIWHDVQQMRTATLAAGTAVLESLQAVFLLITAVILSPVLALWAFLVLPLAMQPINLIARRTLTQAFAVRQRAITLYDTLLQLVRGMRTIRLYHGERLESERATRRASAYLDEMVNAERVRSLATVVMQGLAGVSLVAVIVVGGFQVMRGSLGWPELLAFLMAARASQGPLNNLNTSYLEIQRYGASLVHIDLLLREEPEVRERPDAVALPGPPSEVSVERVSYSVGDVAILRDVSFRVRAGETLGIVGPSGAGKSTLLNLIARVYDPDAGAIRFDGADLRDCRLADVSGAIAMVTQDPFLFATSVRENIRCGRQGATDDEVEVAARAADIHDEIIGMPAGYDTLIGPGNRELSRGEAQRVTIARAILKNAPILLLDEATSSLDSLAESRVQRAVDGLGEGRLVIAVAHRISTLRNATRILVLDEGRVVGLGPHAEVLADCATYRRLWEAQSRSGDAATEVNGAGTLLPDSSRSPASWT
jgi:ABC-type multidrug transport system fused ATPase/permease subunit